MELSYGKIRKCGDAVRPGGYHMDTIQTKQTLIHIHP